MKQTFLFLGGSVAEYGVPIGGGGGYLVGGGGVWLLGQPVVNLQINIKIQINKMGFQVPPETVRVLLRA